jgi:hypothetical protein
VDQASAKAEAESQQPQNQENRDKCPKHIFLPYQQCRFSADGRRVRQTIGFQWSASFELQKKSRQTNNPDRLPHACAGYAAYAGTCSCLFRSARPSKLARAARRARMIRIRIAVVETPC